jgi:perosamine synthetase
MNTQTLALQGGSKTVTLPPPVWPRVGEEEIEAVVTALRASATDTRYISAPDGGGPVREFEEQFADFIGVKFAMTTCGGGPALHIAVMAAGVEAGDEVIVSPYSWGQTVSCILQQNAIPLYADIDPRTYTLDPGSIEDCISESTKAIVVVHIYGNPADMDPILEIAERHGLPVIEDCAQAVGARYKGARVGSFGNLGCFSIGDGKNISGGEGGVLVTSDEKLFEIANLVGQHPARSHAVVKDDRLRRYLDSLIYTYRIHPLSSVIAGVQLTHLDQWNAERRSNADYLSGKLEEISGIEPPFVATGCEHVYHIYSPSFVAEEVDGVSRQTYVRALAAEGVPIGMGYVNTPIHLRPRHQDRQYFYGKHCPWSCAHAARDVVYRPGDCPNAERRCAETELIIGGSTGWIGDQTPLLDQYVAAFEKVTNQLDVLREMDADCGPDIR